MLNLKKWCLSLLLCSCAFPAMAKDHSDTHRILDIVKVEPDSIEAQALHQSLQGFWDSMKDLGACSDGVEKSQCKDDSEAVVTTKFWGESTWFVSAVDTQTGDVVYYHGGSYALSGNHYREVVEYATEMTAHLIDSEFEFLIGVEGDTYTQQGIENKWTEQWHRSQR